MEDIKRKIDVFLQWFCIIIVAVMTFFVTYQVITRYLFNSPSAISEALARYLFVWLTMYGGAYVFGKREHMNLGFIRDKMPLKIKTAIEMFSEFVIAVFAVIVMIIGGYIQTSTQMIQADPSTQIPMGYIYSSVMISGILIVFYSLCNEIKLLKKLKV
ncbi:MAG: TRAP transporter small permease [Elusimicrobiota bacterium]|jgi:TRAP-type C4-dicarboxylate transport system permease small subunit|nr:TRAP transporter small permease [Elusimicrobiota bacterium]